MATLSTAEKTVVAMMRMGYEAHCLYPQNARSMDEAEMLLEPMTNLRTETRMMQSGRLQWLESKGAIVTGTVFIEAGDDDEHQEA